MPIPDLVLTNILWENKPHTLLVRKGKVLELTPKKKISTEVAPVDGGGLMLFPSLIDAHVHLREPGFEYKEDIASGLGAAVAGGFGAVMAMANTKPINDCASVTEYMLDRARQHWPKGPALHPVGALTKGLAGQELAPLAELAEAGCAAFSNDGLPVADNEIFRRAVEYASDLGLKVIDHCEDPSLGRGGLMNEGLVSGRLGLKGQPTVAESLQVARDILIASYLNQPIHLAHISCRQSVELIAWAKAKGIPVTAETCPHYLLWDESLIEGYNTNAKVNPPLRTKDDVLAMRQAVRDGVIDILVTDHAPHAEHEKETPFAEAPNGISGLDTALALTMSLVKKNILSLDDLVRCWSNRPAEIFSLPANRFRPGDRADFFLFDPTATWKVTKARLRSKGKNTPCLGKTMTGLVHAHYLNGALVYSNQTETSS